MLANARVAINRGPDFRAEIAPVLTDLIELSLRPTFPAFCGALWVLIALPFPLLVSEGGPHLILSGSSPDLLETLSSEIKRMFQTKWDALGGDQIIDYEYLEGVVRPLMQLNLPKGFSIIPVFYQERVVGLLGFPPGGQAKNYSRDKLQAVAQEIAYIVKRHEFSLLLKSRFGKDLIMLGVSTNLKYNDRFIERAAKTSLPALIIGEPSCENEYIAYSLHMASDHCRRPFLRIDCLTLDPDIADQALVDLLCQAGGGTIFFDNLDELPYKAQYRLSRIIESEMLPLGNSRETATPNSPRLVAAARVNPHSLAEDKRFYRPLLLNFDFLRTNVHPLRERKEDIGLMISYFLKKYGAGRGLCLSEDVTRLFESYAWPGNSEELERVVARLAVLTESNCINICDVAAYANDLLPASDPSTPAVPTPDDLDSCDAMEFETKSDDGGVEEETVNLVIHMLNQGDVTEYHLHSSIRKALEYIIHNFDQNISLSDISKHACVSRSHLCYLLKHRLGVSFKFLLAIARIEKAKELLVQDCNLSITQISMAVGFSELSHFERVFKRLVNCNPRAYRHAALSQHPKKSDSLQAGKNGHQG